MRVSLANVPPVSGRHLLWRIEGKLVDNGERSVAQGSPSIRATTG